MTDSQIADAEDQTLHRLLVRQMKRYLSDQRPASPEWAAFLMAVNEAYLQSDEDRSLLEHSLELTAQELREANSEVQAVFKRLIDSSADGIFAFDLDFRYIVWNPGMERISGVSRLKTIGKSAFEVFPELTMTGEGRFFHEALAGKVGILRDKPYRTAETGQPGIMDAHYSPLYDEAGAIIGGLAIMRDITERKRAEEALALERDLLQALMDNIPDTIYFKDAASRFTRINHAQARVLGVAAPPDAIGKSEFDFQDARLAQGFYDEEQRLLATGDPIVDRLEYNPTLDGQPRWFSATKVPIWDREGRITGLVGISRDITERKLAQMALQDANKRLKMGLDDLQQYSREIALLNEMGAMLQICQSADEAYTVIGKAARRLFPEQSGAVCITNASRNLVESVAEWGAGPADTHAFAPDDCWALRRGRPHLFQGSQSDLMCRHLGYPPPAAYMCVPMMAQGEALGILCLRNASPESAASGDGPVSLSESGRQLAQTVADTVALALANLRLRETLRQQSIRDPLTGLYNRRYLEETLDREVRRLARAQKPMGVIMLDLDHFKRFNDAFGHDGGDLMLRELGAFLMTHVRGEDIACRYGGEEFTLVLPEASVETAQERAEELRAGVRFLQVMHRGQPLGPLTVSCGVAAFPEHGPSADVVLRAADAALYRAKREGRDRVVVVG